MRMSNALLTCSLVLLQSGCVAAAYSAIVAPFAGDALRSGMKKRDIVLAKGVTPAAIGAKQHLGLSVSGTTPTGQYVVIPGYGTTNGSVFSDMISKEMIRLGYQSRVINDTISEMTPRPKLASLSAQGFEIILVGNLNVGMSNSYGDAMTGGDYFKTGVTAFTIKGIDTNGGDILFILSGEYGKPKQAGQVATDVSQMYAEMVSGALQAAPQQSK